MDCVPAESRELACSKTWDAFGGWGGGYFSEAAQVLGEP